MKIIRCTQTLIKKLNVEPKENIWAKSWLESCHANVFTIDEEQRLERIVYTHGGLDNGGAFEAQKSINRMPTKAIGYKFPIDAFIEKLHND